MSLALPARNPLRRSVAQRQLFSDICVAASCITPKVAVRQLRLVTNTPDSRVAQGPTLSLAFPRLRSRSRLPQTFTPTKPKTFAALASDETKFRHLRCQLGRLAREARLVFPRPPRATSLGPRILGPLLDDLMCRLGAWTLLAPGGGDHQWPLSWPSPANCNVYYLLNSYVGSVVSRSR